MLECPAYTPLRNDWRESLESVGIRSMEIGTVLAASGEHLRFLDLVKFLLTYVRGTGRLDRL